MSPQTSAHSEGFSNSLDPTPARYPPVAATRIAATSELAADLCASLSPRSPSEASARPTGLCRRVRADSLTRQAIQPSGRHNREVGTIGDHPADVEHAALRNEPRASPPIRAARKEARQPIPRSQCIRSGDGPSRACCRQELAVAMLVRGLSPERRWRPRPHLVPVWARRAGAG